MMEPGESFVREFTFGPEFEGHLVKWASRLPPVSNRESGILGWPKREYT
jgi:hypothetical protein